MRTFSATGTFRNSGYNIEPASSRPTELGASLRQVRLRRYSRQHFEWISTVEQTLGSITVAEVMRAMRALFTDAAEMTGPALRRASLDHYPRTGAVLGRWLSLDSIATRRDSTRTRVRLVIGIHIDRLAAMYPGYAAALRPMVGARFHCVAIDDAAAEWARVDLLQHRFSLEIATTRSGHLAPLTGAVRPMPDSLRLHSDIATKISFFTVGVHDLWTRFTLLDNPHVLGWRFQFQSEPKWDFPLGLEHLVTAALAQPFTGPGGKYEVLVTDSVGVGARFQQEIVFDVQESPIVRWLGGASSQLYGAFSDSATVQENAFYASVVSAARGDVNASGNRALTSTAH
jgi:hypothetical protein